MVSLKHGNMDAPSVPATAAAGASLAAVGTRHQPASCVMKPEAHSMPLLLGQGEQAEAFARLIVPKAHGRLTLLFAEQ